MEVKREIYNECYSCRNRRDVPGDAHIECVNPDTNMTGSEHGIKKGWFYYPMLFDPVWKTKLCSNYEPLEAVSGVISGVVSQGNKV
jgi:hypothetical protein